MSQCIDGMNMESWQEVQREASSTSGFTVTHRLAVPGGWVYKVEAWVTGNYKQGGWDYTPKLVSLSTTFVPQPRETP